MCKLSERQKKKISIDRKTDGDRSSMKDRIEKE